MPSRRLNASKLGFQHIPPRFVHDDPDFIALAKYIFDYGAKGYDGSAFMHTFAKSLESFYWKADSVRLLLYRDEKSSKRLSCDSVYHHAFHLMIVRTFGSDLKGMPWTTLLAEAVASNSDLYFALIALRNGRLAAHPSLLKDLERNSVEFHWPSKNSDKLLLRELKTLAEDPFDAYRRAVHGMFGYYRYLWDLYRDRIEGKVTPYEKVFARMKKFDLSLFYMHYNYAVNIPYTVGHCGWKSSKRDQESVRRILTALDEATCLKDFVQRFGVVYPALRSDGAARKEAR